MGDLFVTGAISVLMLLLMAIPGFVLGKMKSVNSEAAVKFLSVMLLYVLQPFVTFDSFLNTPYDGKVLLNIVAGFVFTCVSIGAILGIGALILGCDSCFGVDVDPKAPEVVRSNAALNGFGPNRMQVCAGDIIADSSLQNYLGGGYQLVLANIVADVIIPLSALVRRFMAEGAVFICSGIIDSRCLETEAALKAKGFEILEHRCEDEWNCFVCR